MYWVGVFFRCVLFVAQVGPYVAHIRRADFRSYLVLFLTHMAPADSCWGLLGISLCRHCLPSRHSGHAVCVVRGFLVSHLSMGVLVMCVPCSVPTPTRVMNDAFADTGANLVSSVSTGELCPSGKGPSMAVNVRPMRSALL